MKPSILFLSTVAAFCFSFITYTKGTRVVFFGDSITEAGVKPDGYIAQMRDSLAQNKMDGQFELIGAGISGNKIYDLYLRLESDVLAPKPKIVVIYIGVNDVWHKQTHGTGTDADKFKKFYEAIIAKLQAKKIKVILCTPACIGEKTGGANPLDKDLDAYSQIVRDLAKEKNCALVDLRKVFVAYDLEKNEDNRYGGVLTTDGVHLNKKGNQLVASLLLEELKKAGK
jgi:lysophospholipase L1-like esterase